MTFFLRYITGYFVDFALAGFLDRQLPPSKFSASSRAIRGATHPGSITKYVEHLDEYLKESNMYRL
jgi:hypothetical protein